MPWTPQCEPISCISLQAIESAAANRVANISASIPGEQKLEIELQKPDAVIRLEDITTIHPLGNSAYDKKVGLEQIEFGYKAAKLQEKKLKQMLP